MPFQHTAADGTKLAERRVVPSWVLTKLKMEILPAGLVGVEIRSGLAEVIQTADKKPVLMKLGKLLKQQGKTDKEVRETSQLLTELKVMCNSEVKFATTQDEIYRVYQDGPHSCMKDNESVKAYAGDDTAVAYLEHKGEIIARTVVCNNEEIGLAYVCTYGFGEPLERLLEERGYKSGDLDGCSLLKLSNDMGETLLPYLDGGVNGVDDYDARLVICDGGEFTADSTDGILQKPTCDHCEGSTDNNSYYSEWLDRDLCERCYEESHVNVNGNFYHIEDEHIVELENGEWEIRDEAVFVEYRDEWYTREDTHFNSYTDEYLLKEDLE